MTENEIGKIIVDSAVAVHRELGPGLLESVYEVILAYELGQRGLGVERQVPIPIRYKGMMFDEAFRADVVVEEKVILELKSVERVSEAHKKQVQTYLRLTGLQARFPAKLWRSVNETRYHPRCEWVEGRLSCVTRQKSLIRKSL
jgi:GxxExxY protein